MVLHARNLRSYDRSSVTRRVRGKHPTSHFHIVTEMDSVLSTLELNFFFTKFYEMKDRDGRMVSIYALNYGLCNKQSIEFGRPSGSREFRLYFVERFFDYTPLIRSYLEAHQEIRCDSCDAVHGLEKLESIRAFDMLCPACRRGTCNVTNLSRKYESMLRAVSRELLLPETELGILETLYTENRELPAAYIAAELDCSYQLIGKRGKIMADRGLVERSELSGRRVFTLSNDARSKYFKRNTNRKLDVPDC